MKPDINSVDPDQLALIRIHIVFCTTSEFIKKNE